MTIKAVGVNTLPKDLGIEAVQRIAKLWQVDGNRVVWTEQGFDWWPGRFRVSVKSQKHHDEHEKTWRLIVRTDFLKEVPVKDYECRKTISMMSSFAPSYAWVFTPPEVQEKYEMTADGTLAFQSTVFLREDTAGWLPEFFARMSIFQPIQAEAQSETTAKLLNGQINFSLPTADSSSDYTDEMLDVAGAIYVPAGREESRWKGAEEFEEVANQFGRQDRCFGMGDSTGLTLETPIGTSSTLIRLRTDIPHPGLGNGLLSSVQLPFWQDETKTVEDAMWFNFFQSISWTEVPQLGSWHPREVASGQYSVASGTFYPNALYMKGIATNAALWKLGIAWWIKKQFHADLVDLTMAQILELRLGNLPPK